MVSEKYRRDCGEARPVGEFTRDRSRPDGLSFYCKVRARRRLRRSKDARQGLPRWRNKRAVEVPDGHKWCPDCGMVKPLPDLVRNASQPSGRAPYCKPCHNVRGKASKDEVGGSRTYHLKRRYGITAEEADEMLAEQGGCAPSAGRSPRTTSTTTMTRAGSASCCVSTATVGSGSSGTTLGCSVQLPTTSSDTRPRGDPSAPGRGPQRRLISVGPASRGTGAAATGSRAGRRCRRPPERPATASVRCRAGAAHCPPWPDSHRSGSPVGSRATAPETPARGREADG